MSFFQPQGFKRCDPSRGSGATEHQTEVRADVKWDGNKYMVHWKWEVGEQWKRYVTAWMHGVQTDWEVQDIEVN